MTHHERRIEAQDDNMLAPLHTFMQTAARVQSEFVSLWGRRAEAYLDLPGRVSACRMPSDLVDEQIRFLATMQRNYADCAEAVLRAAMPAVDEAGRQAAADTVKPGRAAAPRESLPHQQAA